MRKLILICLGLMIPLCIYAVRAWPQPTDVRQSDGTRLTVVLHGDEHFHYYATPDGILLVQQQGAYRVADVRPDGTLHATPHLAHNAGQRTADELQAAARQNRQLFLQRGYAKAARRRAPAEAVPDDHTLFPHTGSPRAVVILAQFSDTTFTLSDPKRAFDSYFNATSTPDDLGMGEAKNTRSLATYLSEASLGQFRPQFDVYGPVTLPNPLKTYGGTKENGDDERIDLLLRDACTLMDDSLDFAQYDANDDGYVDVVIIIYAGYSEAFTENSPECIWPIAGKRNGGTYDGKRVARYAVSAELNGYPGCWSKAPYVRINGIGPIAHEFCHTLGLPDFYPTITLDDYDNQSMGYWSLMDTGIYLSNGYKPVALTAWEREALGWIDIPTLEQSATLDIRPIDQGGTAYRIMNDNDPSGNEYFLIEDIQCTGINSAQKGHGLLVYHVDYDRTLFSTATNRVNDVSGHPRMTVVPADGLLFSDAHFGETIDGTVVDNAYFYDQMSGDPFPGTRNVSALNDTMGIASFQVYTGQELNKALSGITEHDDGSISLDYISDFAAGIETITHTTDVLAGDTLFTLDGRPAGRSTARMPRGIYIRRGRIVTTGQ